MRIENELTDEAVVEELGRRISRTRLNRNMTQATLAREAGVSALTVHNIESGAPSQTRNLIRLLRALGMLSNLEVGVPDPGVSPIAQSDLGGRTRQRARPRKSAAPAEDGDGKAWDWGDSRP